MPLTIRNVIIVATLALLSRDIVIGTAALADSFIENADGYVHFYRGSDGKMFKTVRDYKHGTSKTFVDEHDGDGFKPFVTPAPLKVTKNSSASLYDPQTNRTITRVLTPAGSKTFVEAGNTLSKH